MPYTHKKVGDQYCVYKKDGGEKVGCTDGNKEALNKYLAALHINVKKESVLSEIRSYIKAEIARMLSEEEEDGIDTTFDKIHGDLLDVQREMTKLFADLKQNKITKDQYVAKRKELQKKRDNLEKQL